MKKHLHTVDSIFFYHLDFSVKSLINLFLSLSLCRKRMLHGLKKGKTWPVSVPFEIISFCFCPHRVHHLYLLGGSWAGSCLRVVDRHRSLHSSPLKYINYLLLVLESSVAPTQSIEYVANHFWQMAYILFIWSSLVALAFPSSFQIKSSQGTVHCLKSLCMGFKN